jgi:hypothetical protein
MRGNSYGVPQWAWLSVIPTLGIIGWASPLTAAGFLFPATRWCGLLFCPLLTGALAIWPKQAAIAGVCIAAVTNLIHPAQPSPSADWKGINTHFGSIAHGAPNPLAEYQAAKKIQREALSARIGDRVSRNRRTVLDRINGCVLATNARPTQDERKNDLIGARILKTTSARQPLYDFSAELAMLTGAALPFHPACHT